MKMKETNINKGLIELREVNTKKELIQLLLDIKDIEIKARDNYDLDSKTFEDKYLKSTIKYVKKDEDRHIKIIEMLLSQLH
jgi:rubrerythrin